MISGDEICRYSFCLLDFYNHRIGYLIYFYDVCCCTTHCFKRITRSALGPSGHAMHRVEANIVPDKMLLSRNIKFYWRTAVP